LQAVVRREAAREFRPSLTDARVIQMLFIAPLADVVDFGVVDLDLVMDLVYGQSRPGRQRHERRGG
jgi:hypothetical protein